MSGFHVYSDPSEPVDLSVMFAGKRRCGPQFRYSRVWNHWLIHVVTEGKGHVRSPAGTYEVHRGQAFLMCPGEAYRYWSDPADPWSFAWVAFKGSRARAILESTRFVATEALDLGDALGPSLELVDRTIESLREKSPGCELASTGCLYELLGYIRDLCPGETTAPVGAGREFYISRTKDFIDLHYRSQLTVQAIADHIGYDRTYLAKIFKQSTGVSIKAYLTRCRIDEAMRLLHETSWPVAVIADSTGFENYITFWRCFSKAKGVSPSEFRRKSSNGSAQLRPPVPNTDAE